MKIDSKELQQVVAAHVSRLNMYCGIHKAMRAMMADALLALGCMDTDDGLAVAQTSQKVLALLEACASHLDHENAFIHPAMEARAAGSSATIAGEHEAHLARIRQLANATTALSSTDTASRAAAAHALYLDLALFIADNFVHMTVEETHHNAVLWTHYSDAELAAVHDALVASIPQPQMMHILRWLVLSMNTAERAALLGDMQAHATAPAFQAALEVVQPLLRAGDWVKLAGRLGLNEPGAKAP